MAGFGFMAISADPEKLDCRRLLCPIARSSKWVLAEPKRNLPVGNPLPLTAPARTGMGTGS
jgi:hypothetical protein